MGNRETSEGEYGSKQHQMCHLGPRQGATIRLLGDSDPSRGVMGSHSDSNIQQEGQRKILWDFRELNDKGLR